MNDFRNINIGLVENHRSNTPAATDTLSEFVNDIRKGVWAEEIECVRSAVRTHGRDSEPHKTFKNALPAVVLSCEFSSRSKELADSEKFIGYNYILQDDSGIHNEQALGEWKQKFSRDKYRLFTAISPSGDRLKKRRCLQTT